MENEVTKRVVEMASAMLVGCTGLVLANAYEDLLKLESYDATNLYQNAVTERLKTAYNRVADFQHKRRAELGVTEEEMLTYSSLMGHAQMTAITYYVTGSILPHDGLSAMLKAMCKIIYHAALQLKEQRIFKEHVDNKFREVFGELASGKLKDDKQEVNDLYALIDELIDDMIMVEMGL